MRYLSIITVLASSLILAACSSMSSQPRSFDQLGRYQTIPLNQHLYRISFHANGNWSYGTSEEITLVKAAQVTVQQGFDFFKVIDDPSNRINEQQPQRTIVYPNGGFYNPFWYDPFYDRPYVVNVEPKDVSYTIQLFKQSQAPADAFDAHKILQSLGQKYGVSATGQVLPPPVVNKK